MYFRLAPLTTLLVLLNAFPIKAEVWGKVIVDHYECDGDGSSDRIIVATNSGYTLAEVYGGYSDTYKDDLIYGDLNSYGFTDFLNENGDDAGRLYIEDYMAGKSTAREFCWGQ
ncbi:hypothetical protein OAC63_06295 [Amylibacter sp.]|nr:hypothetical protein [Amylibacter sp.]